MKIYTNGIVFLKTVCYGLLMSGDELRERRLALRLTQEELANFLSVTPNTIARWERGEREVSPLADFRVEWLEQRLNLLPIHRTILTARYDWIASIENIVEAPTAPVVTFTITFKRVKDGSQRRTLRFTAHTFTLYKNKTRVLLCITGWLLDKEGDGEIDFDALEEHYALDESLKPAKKGKIK
jgi:transcriptional regulator with XRE-family HTH domain